MARIDKDKLARFYGATDPDDEYFGVSAGDIWTAFEKGYAPSELPKGQVDDTVWGVGVSGAKARDISIPTVGDEEAPKTGSRSVEKVKSLVKSGDVPGDVSNTTLNKAKAELLDKYGTLSNAREGIAPTNDPQAEGEQETSQDGMSAVVLGLILVAVYWVVS